jgi:hypothetical protein
LNFIFYADDDSGLPLNFGSGSSNQLLIDVPANGSRIIQSYGASKNTVQGWATALSDIPVCGDNLIQGYTERQSFD